MTAHQPQPAVDARRPQTPILAADRLPVTAVAATTEQGLLPEMAVAAAMDQDPTPEMAVTAETEAQDLQIPALTGAPIPATDAVVPAAPTLLPEAVLDLADFSNPLSQ